MKKISLSLGCKAFLGLAFSSNLKNNSRDSLMNGTTLLHTGSNQPRDSLLAIPQVYYNSNASNKHAFEY